MKTTRLTKLDIAVSQLRLAISLFVEGHELISAITLAGAAEEILGKLAQQAGMTPAVHLRAESTRLLYRYLWKTEPGLKPFVNVNNMTRNDLKHLGSGDPVEVDLVEEAMHILDRAVENYRLLHARVPVYIGTYDRMRKRMWHARNDA
jgi:hypothetical protein